MSRSSAFFFLNTWIHLFFLAGAFSFLISCSSKPESTKKGTSIKFDQYYVHGEVLYATHCSNCHQKTGTGLGRVYPPLVKSDFMDRHPEAVICLIRNGKEGELIVNGKSFNQRMPGIPSLTDLEIAEITTFIYNAWGGEREMFEVNEVSRVLMGCDSLVVGDR